MKNKIQKVLDETRKHLQADGGDVELVDYDEKTGVVKVHLKGACASCPMAQITLSEGIGKTIKEQIPEVKDVIAV